MFTFKWPAQTIVYNPLLHPLTKPHITTPRPLGGAEVMIKDDRCTSDENAQMQRCSNYDVT